MVGAVVVGVIAAGLLVLHVVAALVLAESITRSKRRRVQGTPEDLGLRCEEIQFLTADRLVLRGWFLDSPGARATVITVHDIDGTRADREQGLLELQRDYVRRGFNVFAFDLRGRGESAGKRDGLGGQERLDVQAAISYVRRRSGTLPILLHGFGFGASMAILAAARDGQIAGVVADSPMASMRAYLRERHPRVPRYLFALTSACCRRVFHADIDAAEPLSEIPRVRTPMLFIHAEGDPVVSISHTLNLAAASLCERNEVWTVPDMIGHCGHYLAAPETYMRRCLDFVDDVVPARVLEAAAV